MYMLLMLDPSIKVPQFSRSLARFSVNWCFHFPSIHPQMPNCKSYSPPLQTLILLLALLFISISISISRRNSSIGVVKADEVSAEDGEDLAAELEELLAVDHELEQQGVVEAKDKEEAAASSSSKKQRVKSGDSDTDAVRRAAKGFVIELNNDNAQTVIEGNQYVLVLGYAPWCSRSAELMPHFSKAAADLKELGSSVVIAKVDADRFTKAASYLGIKGFPTLLLFVNGTAQTYTGGLTGEEIVLWTRKKTGVPVIRLSSINEAEMLLQKHHILLIGYFENFEVPYHDEFLKAAKLNNEVQFVESNDLKAAEVIFPGIPNKSAFFGLVKSEPERYVSYEGAYEMEKILHFIEMNKFPLVTTLTELNAARVYASLLKSQVFIFAETDEFKNLVPSLQNVASQFKSKIMFIHVDIAETNLAKPILTIFGLEPEKPTVLAFSYGAGPKYLLESEVTTNTLQEFCSGLLNGTLLPYYKSEPVPEATGLVKKVVGKTFEDLVLKSQENILLEVHTPWCMLCETVSKQVEKLAKHLEVTKDLVFARIDAAANEHPGLQVQDFPTLLLYTAEDKSKPVKLSTKSSAKQMASFIRKTIKAEGDTGVSQDQKAKDEL